jgi:DNA polymerase delta subunit 1
VFDDTQNNYTFTIQMFGVNEIGDTCSIFVNDYKPFFYVKVGDNWTYSNVLNLVNYIKHKNPQMEDCILNAELVDKYKLYGFSAGKEYKFVKFTFKNLYSMNRVKNMWYEYNDNNERKMKMFMFPPNSSISINLELYESNIPPLLRYFHIYNISPSGWISVLLSTNNSKLKTTTCTYEHWCSSNQIKPMNEKELSVPFKICSFDIEASSSHGDFPIPIKNYKKLATNIIENYNSSSENFKLNYDFRCKERKRIFIFFK